MPPVRVRSTADSRVLLVLASGLLQRFCRYLAAAVACSRARPAAALCSYLAAPAARLASGLLQRFARTLRRLWLVSRAACCGLCSYLAALVARLARGLLQRFAGTLRRQL